MIAGRRYHMCILNKVVSGHLATLSGKLASWHWEGFARRRRLEEQLAEDK